MHIPLQVHVEIDVPAVIVVVDGTTTYVAKAPKRTLHTEAKWEAMKITSSPTVVKHAVGFVTPGTNGANLSGLTYV